MFIGILLILFGFLLILNPEAFWVVTESWKSDGATEPSSFYKWSTRFGGMMCVLVGAASIIVSTF
ncbi:MULTISPECIES: DUF6199 family natural product biosynthesis protein [Bacillaceae]|uniref:DUF6199 domain-containing protein n=1 Tax=Gottfriedia luciferensis TaxID=178774 RepID=A0ABX2ZUJ1_9BACI|nr:MULTISPECIES: DUF6199 family natural product biosynthesis protein [Bacillaceae]ODG93362.1 hypothetical protein BED47_03475 [Gottfriedia luciferensis]PGZ94982.1 hypothetical protein COE53_00030 [Bacillus sp. AFS029533]SFC49282.1 hypothetical protein SAMN02799633_00985 [Bacillus sp. UNCCL81]